MTTWIAAALVLFSCWLVTGIMCAASDKECHLLILTGIAYSLRWLAAWATRCAVAINAGADAYRAALRDWREERS